MGVWCISMAVKSSKDIHGNPIQKGKAGQFSQEAVDKLVPLGFLRVLLPSEYEAYGIPSEEIEPPAPKKTRSRPKKVGVPRFDDFGGDDEASA